MQRADKRKFHYVYRIDRFDGKFYIGMHSTDLMEDGYFGSGTHLSNSIRYHGKDKHTKIILEFFETRQEAKDHEKFLITDEMRSDKLCMNIAPGGGGGFHDAAHQRKCSSAGGKVGGKIAIQIITRDKAARAKALETKRRNGTSYTQGMLNKKHSVESCARMSIAGSGEKNSQYGTCWVTDGTKPVKIKKEHLDKYLVKGFRRGRK